VSSDMGWNGTGGFGLVIGRVRGYAPWLAGWLAIDGVFVYRSIFHVIPYPDVGYLAGHDLKRRPLHTFSPILRTLLLEKMMGPFRTS